MLVVHHVLADGIGGLGLLAGLVAGATVADVIPLGIVSGNVTVAFTVLSYAGTLTVGIAAEPTACPDLDDLQELLQAGLDELAVAPPGPGASGS